MIGEEKRETLYNYFVCITRFHNFVHILDQMVVNSRNIFRENKYVINIEKNNGAKKLSLYGSNSVNKFKIERS